MEDQDKIRDEQRFVLDEIAKDARVRRNVEAVENHIQYTLCGALPDNDAKTLFEAALIRWMRS